MIWRVARGTAVGAGHCERAPLAPPPGQRHDDDARGRPVVLAVLALLLILGHLVAKGASSLDWSFFTRNPCRRAHRAAAWRTRSSERRSWWGSPALIGLPIGIGTGLLPRRVRVGPARMGCAVRGGRADGTPSIVSAFSPGPGW